MVAQAQAVTVSLKDLTDGMTVDPVLLVSGMQVTEIRPAQLTLRRHRLV